MILGIMINGIVNFGGMDYVEIVLVYGLDDGEEFDFDVDEIVYSDYEAIDQFRIIVVVGIV